VLWLSDFIAPGIYAACIEFGLSIPGNVAVAGFATIRSHGCSRRR
jgi:DNA-binding LacI/PurR family transcriptional regulator